jgi:signal transduction histidine kinase
VLKRDELSPEYIMHVVDNHKQNISEDPVEITETTANLLLSLPDTIAAAYNGRGKLRLRALKNNVIYDINTFQTEEKYLLQCATLFSLFDDESFITAPYRQQDVIAGRIYLIGSKQPFNRSDVAFIKQVADALSSVAENMHLIENLVEEAGGQERHRLSLDVHDTTIQPYIGLTLALDGLAREFKTNLPLAEKIGEIINMANMTVQDLRSYKDNLRQKAMMRGEFLIPAVQHHSERLLRFYGIQINVQGSVDPHRIEGLAEAAFQIIKEGLSNILRHTKARKGFVEIQCSETHLQIKIGNEINTALFNAASFKPKSIQERVLTLKGETTILNDVAGHTVVKVDIPLIKGRYFKD